MGFSYRISHEVQAAQTKQKNKKKQTNALKQQDFLGDGCSTCAQLQPWVSFHPRRGHGPGLYCRASHPFSFAVGGLCLRLGWSYIHSTLAKRQIAGPARTQILHDQLEPAFPGPVSMVLRPRCGSLGSEGTGLLKPFL